MINLYWCRGDGRTDPRKRNFGDYLSPLIVEMVSGKTMQFASVHKADMMAIGTIMNREKKAKNLFFSRKLHVWGSGTDSENRSFSSRHYYHAVRGEKTLEQINLLGNVPAFGDPGLLASMWYEGRRKPRKKYKLGVIPHYVDKENPVIERVSRLSGVKIIDVFWDVPEVLRAIQECHFVVSSSLHGLIVADSFGIPNRRVLLSDGMVSSYKFVDYYSAFSIEEPSPLTPNQLEKLAMNDPALWLSEYARPNMSRLCSALVESFPSL